MPLVRVPTIRPSGFWMTLKTSTAWSSQASTCGSSPYGVVATRSIVRMTASVPSYSLPWMLPWMKIGTFSSRCAISSFARRGLRCARAVTRSRWAKSLRCARVSSALIVTLYMSRPSAERPMTSTRMRPALRLAMSWSVQPIA